MPIEIEGVEYFSASDIRREFGVFRQTLRRWRKARQTPQGRRYRDKNVAFTRAETIRGDANRLVPVDAPQLRHQGESRAAQKEET